MSKFSLAFITEAQLVCLRNGKCESPGMEDLLPSPVQAENCERKRILRYSRVRKVQIAQLAILFTAAEIAWGQFFPGP